MTLDEEAGISEGLRRLAEADLALEAPPALEARLLGALRERRTKPRAPSRAWMFGALAASLALAATLVSRPAMTPAELPASSSNAVSESEAFVPLTYDDPLADVDAVHVVRVALDRAALASYGLPSSGAGAATVEAELLVGQDGLARGIRFVNQ